MNKTEPVREREQIREFGSSDLGNFDAAELTNFDIAHQNASLTARVRNFQTPAVADSPDLEVSDSDTSKLPRGVTS